MSISVTVNGNPVCIRRRIVLSDLEQIKKNERERRRRLRLEQVRQQSREISSKLLDRAKNMAKKTISELGNGKDSEMKRLHDKRILEIQQKYQDDMEDIGLAHTSAEAQPNVDAILETERLRNQLAAAERGKEAVQRLRDSALQEDPAARQQERLRQVREVENVRSTMISNLAKRSPPKSKKPSPPPSLPTPAIPPTASPKKQKLKKSPEKGKSHGAPSPQVLKSPSPQQPQRVLVDVHQETRSPNPEGSKKSSAKPAEPTTYNPSDYQQQPGSSTLSISDDSSYFSDPASAANEAPARAPAAASSKIHFYDHTTRQKKTYDHPKGLVERLQHRTSPDAIELARRTSSSRSKSSAPGDKPRQARAAERGASAALRERVKKDYKNLLENLDHLSREERRLRAARACPEVDKNRQQRRREAKQAALNRAYECQIERIITLEKEESSGASSPDSLYDRSEEDSTAEPAEATSSRSEQILEMLRKVERQKRLLLEEFGSNLPDEIFTASTKRLFDDAAKPETAASPEIEIIRVGDEKRPGRSEIAVQTSVSTELNDKSVQVELLNAEETTTTTSRLEYVEPIVTVLTPEAVSSSDSGGGIVIDFGRKQVKVTPRKSKRRSVKSLPASGRSSPAPISVRSDSAPGSRAGSPQEAEEEPRRFRLPERRAQVMMDTSTDVSFGGPGDERRGQYVRPRQPILKKLCAINSDTSTSYASLPVVEPGGSFVGPVEANVTPILQLLDSSGNGSVRRLRNGEVSPVSTPETPSPRILRVPTNVPDAEKLGRILRFEENSGRSVKGRRRLKPSKAGNVGICECRNPACRLVHEDLSQLKEEAEVRNNPETVKRYDELQNICAERIASLTALIKQVRDDKREDYSLTGPSDDTSLMQMPEPRPRTELCSVQRLVESIEAIHSRLAKTLQESQQIITGSFVASRATASPMLERSDVPTPKLDRSPRSPEPAAPRGPRVISDETVQLDLQRFKPPPKHDEIVERLSQEILEQSKSAEKTTPRELASASPVREETKEAFVPLLAGIPREPRALPAVPAGNGGRRRPPPVSQFIEALSPPHELSTIAEFDTPDTANRSQMSARSPGKSRRALATCSSLRQDKIPEEERKPSDSGKSTNSEKINKITSSSSNSFSGLSGISEILSTPTSDVAVWASSPPEQMEDHLRKLGLGWAIPILRKTRQASALSSSSNSDITLVATMRRTKSPVKKSDSSTQGFGLPDFSNVSSISIREASKSTEKAVLRQARTSTPNVPNSNSSSDKSTGNSTISGATRDNSDSINGSFKNR